MNLLRVRASDVLSRHRHSGPVHAFTLRGEWHYLEHDWIAKTGDYVFEPPGETHTLDAIAELRDSRLNHCIDIAHPRAGGPNGFPSVA